MQRGQLNRNGMNRRGGRAAAGDPVFFQCIHATIDRLCYWGATAPILLLEHLALDTPWGQKGLRAVGAALASSGGSNGGCVFAFGV